MEIKSAKDLIVYRKAYELAMRIFEISKLTDCDGENSETDTSLDFARDCAYITAQEHCELTAECQDIGKMLGSMIRNPGKFLLHTDL
ncbi:MAG: four helix bundle protein [Verrucomicrobia bacterium]|nr:four helix bundle protein [Verrucomicrobiota bacterium]MBU4247822.1 four helix bundle protein [Verrucomicrobiota bacterium]MBU4291952.1 four helix bundle protein [Verrucomicrobiota bacterium]MBU4498302.1 four helix bundle protein [Verrucomicrobiota bacterium]MCG2678421.1 four helix bundle protein [Kiritimatiellia bacterium]